MNHVSDICSQVEADLKSWRKLVLIFMIVFVSFAITILYALSNVPTGSESCLPDVAGRSDL
ncbi:unnamed protein product [Nesidiocoris tenuis]|nr:unnamed protein product [Nesidiocoris tenuis]